jgi:hypothetical protein
LCLLTLLLVNLGRGFSILFIFLKNQLFVSLIHCIVFFVSISLISVLIFIYFHLVILILACSCFSKSLSFIRVFIWDLIFFSFLVELGFELSVTLAKQVLYCLSHTSSPFFVLVILEMRVLRILCWACNPPDLNLSSS